GRLLGIKEPFLYKVVETVIEENKVAYPNLVDSRDYIIKVVKTEEERFAKTIDSGMELLNSIVEKLEAEGGEKKVLSGDVAFKLYDTFGFPVDLTREILDEKNIAIDEEEFVKLMNEQRDRARKAREENVGDVSWEGDVLAGLDHKTEFVGYGCTECEAKVVAIVASNELCDALNAGEKAALVLDKTPFYAESGGQVGDLGTITVGANVFKVNDCKKSPTGQFLHIGEMVEGSINSGAAVTAAVLAPHRSSIMKNHTAAHLLQYALREVLGSHVHQAGQLVDADFCRFDFTHFSGVTAEELAKVEALVNEMIFACLPVNVSEMTQEEAKASGAMALFSEKYADIVRVVNVGGRSVELCGGTHVDNTAKLGLFKILKESSVAAGVRRIEAVTGAGVLAHIAEMNSQLAKSAELLKVGSFADIPAKITALQADLKAKDREIDSMSQKLAASQINDLFADAKDANGIKVVTAALESKIEEVKGVSALFAQIDGMPTDQLRNMVDMLLNKADVVVLAGAVDGKVAFAAGATKATVGKGAHAGNILKAAAKVAQGGGGGRPDAATAGGKDVTKTADALVAAKEALAAMIK
ncbi:MAG: alanine--tRNA ligase, partial [Clostridia bacterium]|nr:alanine--tRNA ligase [Clostridia bacterium]